MSAVSVAPVLLSQRNCEAAVGMKPRRYLETLRALKIPHVEHGALRLVEPAVFVAALAAAKAKGASEPADHAEQLRQRLGKRRAG